MGLRPALELAMSLPFRIDEYGTVAATVDESKLWADRVRSVIGTAIGERIYRPEFGCRAAQTVFETEEATEAILQADIRSAFQSYLPTCGLESVEVSYDEPSQILTAEVTYSTPSSDIASIQVGVATLNGDQPISEEITWQTL